MVRHFASFGLAVVLVAAVASGQETAIKSEDGSTMVLVPGGPFVMGSGEGQADEAPPHRVILPAFYIDRTEVTCAQYAKFLQATKTRPPTDWIDANCPAGREDLPITNITWFDAMRYAQWAGKRLPTEAEWEKAARGIDGRRFPWGNADDKEKRNLESRKDTQRLEPVDARPAGASPYGALNMSGNAWEWTADWYGPYPSSTHESVQFGKKYKVVRGGGAEYYYGLKNLGTTTQRIRTLPYGTHDFIGFRCAKSVDPKDTPYDPAKLESEAQSLLNAALRPPKRLSYEDEFAQLLKAGQFPLSIVGAKGQSGVARVGIPFPRGLMREGKLLDILGPDGVARAAQQKVLARWDDGSARWMLVSFPATAGEQCVLRFNDATAAKAAEMVKVDIGDEQYDIATGPIVGRVCKDMPLESVKFEGGRNIVKKLNLRLEVESGGRVVQLKPLDPLRWDNEDQGPVRFTTRLEGPMGEDRSKPSNFRYDIRLSFSAGSPRVELLATITHKAKRNVTVNVRDASLSFTLASPPSQIAVATDGGMQTFDASKAVVLDQGDDLKYQITRDGANVGEGTRSPGWISAAGADGAVTLGVEHFWQNSPKALFASGKEIGVRLWAGQQPFDWEGGLAKTHRIVLDFSKSLPAECTISPLRVSMSPAWACGTEALGAPMLPRGREAIERFSYWEIAREASMQKWVRSMPAGFRHFGDAYLGGPYKGKNAYVNLEYDVHYNFLMEYLRTGQTWYLDAAEAMARHQADIDTDHWTGQPWKHSPQHTTTEAELGHVFLRGLVLHYALTGEQRSLDAAREIGDWIAATLEKGQGTGNERQIGWSLYALTGLYDITREPKYLHACETLCNRLLAGQSPTGQFKTIRWDNRISFFNGIAMNGMLTVYEHNRDEKLAEGVLRVANRTLGMYPEYACRTLNAYIWAARRTKDPRYLDAIERTWELSTEYLQEPVTEETHAWHFRDFAARQDLFPLFAKAPAFRPDPKTWQAIRLRRSEAEVYLQPTSEGEPAPVMIIREGHGQGRAEVFDAGGRQVASFEFPDAQRMYQAAAFALPKGKSAARIRLSGGKARGWQVHYDANSRLTVYDPVGAQIPDLFPRAFGYVEDGATQIQIKLEAMGEGFHMATLYDPAGRPVKTVRHFIDFEDPGRYELELKLDSKTPFDATRPWSLEVYNCKVLSAKGMLPYWSMSPGQLFHPEREQEGQQTIPILRSAR